MTTKQMKRLKPNTRSLKNWAREMARLPIGNNSLTAACKIWLHRKGLAA